MQPAKSGEKRQNNNARDFSSSTPVKSVTGSHCHIAARSDASANSAQLLFSSRQVLNKLGVSVSYLE